MLAFLRLDIKEYVEYNPMALFMVSAVLLYLFRDFFQKKKWIDWYMGSVLFINSIVYVLQIFDYLAFAK